MLEWNRIIASLVLLYSLFFTPITSAADTFDPSQFIRDGETIVSYGGMFEMGFFSPGGSKNRYVGIWYKKISTGTVVWVANREVPITDTSGVLKIISPGRIVLVDGNNTNVWSSNTRRPALKPTIAQLLDSGNLVVRDLKDDSPEKFLWQSFDYPGDTLLPGMKLGIEFSTGLERYLSSWRSMDDPSAGYFTYYCDPKGYPQTMLKRGNITEVRSGFWNDRQFIGMYRFNQVAVYSYRLVLNKEEVYYIFIDWSPVVSRFVLTENRIAEHLVWSDKLQSWLIYMSVLTYLCDTYSLCGAYGRCNINYAPPCTCLHKFVPRNHEEWNSRDWSNGCVRRTPLSCSNDGFLKYSGIKLPDSSFSWFDERMSLDECSRACLRNCTCVAYANKDITTGCIHWFDELIDIRDFNEGGQDIYIRMADTELDPGSGRKKREVITMLLSTLAGLVLLGTTLTVYAWRRKKSSLQKREEGTERQAILRDYTLKSPNEDVELQSFSLSTIENATNNFSDNSKLGQGGFGPVYKGLLEEGREVAVKRLSKTSKQGLDEFKNEVICIAKLQHRNLVKLLGCCTQGDEMMLIYEYMPNRSLDCFIFDESQSSRLDWPKRFNIINGIARGLTYLHQDSRLRIVHRDLKAGNILLDIDMNPKISDFGLARRFCGLETGANTNTVVGTYGYISPEYAVNGVFSVKSDVFSFGVMVLEIVSGKKNRGFSHRDHHDNLLGHAWRLYKEGKSLELIDEPLGHSYTESEVLRSIQVGLLCVQQRAEDRPSMSSVVMMLGSEGAILPPPNQPGFFVERSIPGLDCAQSKPLPVSINEITMTLLDAR